MALNAKQQSLLAQLGLGLSIATTNCDAFGLLLPGTPTKSMVKDGEAQKFYTLEDHPWKFHKDGTAKAVFVDLVNTNESYSKSFEDTDDWGDGEMYDAEEKEESSTYCSRMMMSLNSFSGLLAMNKSMKFNPARFPDSYFLTKEQQEDLSESDKKILSNFNIILNEHSGKIGKYKGLKDSVRRLLFIQPKKENIAVQSFEVCWYKSKTDKDASLLFPPTDKLNRRVIVDYFLEKAVKAANSGIASASLSKIGIDTGQLTQSEIDGVGLRYSTSNDANIEYVRMVVENTLKMLSAQYDAELTKVAPLTKQLVQQFASPVIDASDDF